MLTTTYEYTTTNTSKDDANPIYKYYSPCKNDNREIYAIQFQQSTQTQKHARMALNILHFPRMLLAHRKKPQ